MRILLIAALLLAPLAAPAAGLAAMAEGHLHQDRAAYQDQWVETLPDDPSDAWMIGFGGRMYDQWAEPQGKNLPVRTHPRFPRSAEARGPETWRCKTCHGWDYQGRPELDMPGIASARDMPIEDVIAVLRDGTHRYTENMIPNGAAVLLARFVAEGQVDMATAIDPETGAAKGDPEKGKGGFQNLCATCHGYDGRAQNFGNSDQPEYLGTYGKENPWEVLHKARNGQPGEAMPANLWLQQDQLIDIIAYIQTLPTR